MPLPSSRRRRRADASAHLILDIEFADQAGVRAAHVETHARNDLVVYLISHKTRAASLIDNEKLRRAEALGS